MKLDDAILEVLKPLDRPSEVPEICRSLKRYGLDSSWKEISNTLFDLKSRNLADSVSIGPGKLQWVYKNDTGGVPSTNQDQRIKELETRCDQLLTALCLVVETFGDPSVLLELQDKVAGLEFIAEEPQSTDQSEFIVDEPVPPTVTPRPEPKLVDTQWDSDDPIPF